MSYKGVHDTVHVKTGRFILVQLSCPSNKNLTENMVYTPILGLIDMGLSGTLDILYSALIEFGRECNQRCINAAETNLVSELRKAHHHKQVSAFELDGMSIAIASLYALVEFISWYERQSERIRSFLDS